MICYYKIYFFLKLEDLLLPIEPYRFSNKNNDWKIFISKDVKSGSAQEKQVKRHEGKHADDMKKGILDYGDDWVRYKGKTYPRKDGKIKYDNKWSQEGSNVFPWEKRAVKAEKTKQDKITDGREQSAAFQKK